jgi:orotate phosphoribosyltransferase-like protein
MRHHWKTTELARVRTLAGNGLTIRQICEEMNLPRSAIEYAIRQTGSKARPANTGVLPVPPWWWKGT